jgi:drug/metabolite transporter (DMT)-like permease
MSHFYGILLMFFAACCYGASGILIKLAYRAGMEPAGLLPLQNVAALVCLWPMLYASGGMVRPRPGRMRRLVWQGLLGNFAISVCYFWSAQRIDISLLSIILFTYPGLVLAYKIAAEKHKTATSEWTALVLSLAGAVLSVNPFHGTYDRVDVLGLLLAVGAAASYAFMNIHGQKLSLEMSPQTITAVTSTVSTLALMAVLPARHWLTLDFTPQQWLYIAALGLFSTVLPMNLMYLAIRRIGAFHASVVSIAELPCILVLAFWILGERISLWQMLGSGLILLSVVLMQFHTSPPPGQDEIGHVA